MIISKIPIIVVIFLLSFCFHAYGTSSTSFSNLTHTCKVYSPMVCVDLVIQNKTCVDLKCVINVGGNISECTRTTLNAASLNITSLNRTATNSSTSTCNGTWIYPNSTSYCLNTTIWNNTVCVMNNVTCQNSFKQCSLNPVFYIGGFFNLNDKDGWGNLPAAELALRQVNENTTILNGTTVHLVAKQSTQVTTLSIYIHYTKRVQHHVHPIYDTCSKFSGKR